MTANDMLISRLKRIYDDYRTALMNTKYYAHRLRTYRRWNLTIECCLAIGTSGAIGAWAIWNDSIGMHIWAVMTGCVTLLAILKPILQFSAHIERYSKLHSSYSVLFHDIKRLVSDIDMNGSVTQDIVKSLRHAEERFKSLAPDDDPNPSKTLLEKYYNEVIAEIPAQDLWGYNLIANTEKQKDLSTIVSKFAALESLDV